MIAETMINIPDITGYILGKAESVLKGAGVETISIVMTSVPLYKQEQYQAGKFTSSRVLRQRVLDDGKAVELTVCELHI